MKNISEFQNIYRRKKDWGNNEFSTEFDLHYNLKNNKGWSIFSYYLRASRNSLNIDKNLALLLSDKLGTEVIEYYEYSVANMLVIRRHHEGATVDKLSSSDSIVEYGEGYFEKFNSKTYETAVEFQREIEWPYLEKYGLDFEAEELQLYNTKSWRRFYLKGSRENIKEFLLHKLAAF